MQTCFLAAFFAVLLLRKKQKKPFVSAQIATEICVGVHMPVKKYIVAHNKITYIILITYL